MRTLLWITFLAVTASAQPIEVKSLFHPASLSGPWKHQTGDDPRWADPAFDDSSWPSVQMPEAAFRPTLELSWYRFRVRLPETMPNEPLAVLIGGFGDSQAYEVFWNGQRAGAMGELDTGAWGQLITAPKAILVAGPARDAVLAIRLRASQGRFIGNFRYTSWIGTEDAMRERVQTLLSERLRRVLPQLLIAVSLLLSGVLFLLFPLWRRDATEYLWFGLWLVCVTAIRVFSIYPDIVGLQTSLAATWGNTLSTLGTGAAWIGLMRTLFLGRMTRTVWFALAAFVAMILGPAAFITAGGSISAFDALLINTLANCYFVFTYYQIGRLTSRETERMPAVHVAILAYFAVNFVAFTARFFWQTEAVNIQGALARTVSLLLFTFAITILMNQRSARLLRDRQRLSGELASAAEVQSLLLTSLPSAGDLYRVEPVYLPASEVGGDFYQVLERPHGTRVVLVGDVSGKGLKAAMLVSVTVGMLRRETSSGPAEILAALNDGLCGRTGGSFVTCCCARFDPDGTVTIANAGHPAPYCDGQEVELDSGLPLGLAPGVQYAESLSRGERYTLVSDGVVEAENPNRELFGFDRTRAISGQSAQQIAETAQSWGQNDDITVVTIQRTKC